MTAYATIVLAGKIADLTDLTIILLAFYFLLGVI